MKISRLDIYKTAFKLMEYKYGKFIVKAKIYKGFDFESIKIYNYEKLKQIIEKPKSKIESHFIGYWEEEFDVKSYHFEYNNDKTNLYLIIDEIDEWKIEGRDTFSNSKNPYEIN